MTNDESAVGWVERLPIRWLAFLTENCLDSQTSKTNEQSETHLS